MGGEDLHLRVLKVIAVVDLLKDRSGLVASLDLLKRALPGCGNRKLAAALADLQSWSLIVFRKFARAYAIFEGSDFDIDHAVEQASAGMSEMDFSSVGAMAGLQPIVAKRHYHETGALRWFDVGIVPLVEVEKAADDYTPRHGAIGGFFLAIPTLGETEKAARKICRKARTDVSRMGYRRWSVAERLEHSRPSGGVVGTGARASTRRLTCKATGLREAKSWAASPALQGQLEIELGRGLRQRVLVP